MKRIDPILVLLVACALATAPILAPAALANGRAGIRAGSGAGSSVDLPVTEASSGDAEDICGTDGGPDDGRGGDPSGSGDGFGIDGGIPQIMTVDQITGSGGWGLEAYIVILQSMLVVVY